MKAGFLEKLIERLGRIGPEEVQTCFLLLAQDKGFLETVFNAIQEGIIVTDSGGRITYLNDAACGLFGLEAADAIGKPLDERIRGLDWESLTQSGGPVSHDTEIFYPQNRFINFYIVPLVIEHRESVAGVADSGRVAVPISERGGLASTIPGKAEQVGHVMILRDITESRRTAQQTIESERLNALTLLAAGVAHEIGNPLNSLHIHLQLMQRSVQKLDGKAKAELEQSIDIGSGMSAGNLSRVFEPYFTTKPSGTGLGLLIVRRVVREHGGELSIESSQGKGLTLTIRLPYIQKPVRMLEAGESKPQG